MKHRGRGGLRMRAVLPFLFAVAVALVFAQTEEADDFSNRIDNNDPPKPRPTGDKKLDAELLDLATANNLTQDESFRCGVFFAGKPNEKPRLKIFVVPKRFRADCSAPEPEVYSNRCYSLFNKFLGRLTWESPSRRRPDPYKMGDDICVLFNKETNNTYGAEVPNKTIKRGLQVGFYYNYCGETQWKDTSLRVPDRVCCGGEREYKKCQGKRRRNRNRNKGRGKGKGKKNDDENPEDSS